METQKKVQIGKPDLKLAKKITSDYAELTGSATAVKWLLNEVILNDGSIPLDLFFEFLKTKEPETFLKKKFVELRGVNIPGISTEELIKSNLLDIKKDRIELLMEVRNTFFEIVAKMEGSRYEKGRQYVTIPLRSFYIEENYDGFDIPKAFESDIIEKLTLHTENETEIQILEKLQALATAVNDLVELKLLAKDIRCFNIYPVIGSYFKFNKGVDRLVEVDPLLFLNSELRRRFDVTTPDVSTFDATELLA